MNCVLFCSYFTVWFWKGFTNVLQFTISLRGNSSDYGTGCLLGETLRNGDNTEKCVKCFRVTGGGEADLAEVLAEMSWVVSENERGSASNRSAQ